MAKDLRTYLDELVAYDPNQIKVVEDEIDPEFEATALVEGAKRAHTDGMLYGAPTGSMGLMAYDFEINGSDGQGSRNVERLLLAILLGGLGLGAFALRKRGSLPFRPQA